MPLEPGTTLGPYQVTAKIGEGGMGEVWQARDTKLDRDVALKVLPEAFTSDPDRLARFERDAKVLASLNHPNIGSIYGLEEAAGIKALVLELVEGPTLADRIAKGPIPIDEALPIAKQIAEALEAAHEQGVIHRDLKPANVKVKDDGTVKVLDFGLAKALEPTVSAIEDAAQSPTLTVAATQQGMILGTAAYMSPEQARGSSVDKRADIWAFGVLLYELLVGRRPFCGETVSDTLAQVLTKETDWARLPAEVPASVRRLLERCLDRDVKRRLRDIGEARVSLDESEAAPAGEPAAVRPRSSPADAWQRAAPWLGGVVVGSLLTGLAITSLRRSDPAPVGRFAVLLPATSLLAIGPGPVLALSPDGRTLAYVAQQDGQEHIYRRAFDDLEASLIPGTVGARAPFFSPDGQWLGFVADGLLKKVSMIGGPPITVCEAPGLASGASWAPDDTIVFTLRNGGLLRVAATGGTPEPLTEVATDGGVQDHLWPEVTAGGDAVLYTVWSGSLDTAQVAIRSLSTDRQATLVRGTRPLYMPTGHLVFVRDASLWAVPFDLDAFEVTGPEVAMIDDVLVNTGGGAGQFTSAPDGTLAYTRGGTRSTAGSLIWMDRQGRSEPLPVETGEYRAPRLSPNGTQVALTRARAGVDANADIWIADVARGGLRRLTTDPAPDGDPLWTVDGTHVVFSSFREGSRGLFWKDVDGAQPVERLMAMTDSSYVRPEGWSPDGSMLVFEFGSREGVDIGVLSMEDRTWIPLLDAEANERDPQVSPDGEWIAYSSDEAGRYQVYVERFPELGARQRISAETGRHPLWSASGDELLYVGAESTFFAVPVETGTVLTTGTPEALFQWASFGAQITGFPERQHDITQNGEKFLLLDTPGIVAGGSEIIIVENWSTELERRVPRD